MELTVAYLEEQFALFNQQYFNNELPQPRLVVSNSRTQLGRFCLQRIGSWPFGLRKRDSYTIRVSAYYDVEEKDYQNILLHEMIHYYIAYKHIHDTSSHGAEFERIMNWLNKEHGWNITKMAQTKGWTVAARNKKTRSRHVLALQARDGKCYMSVVHPKYIQYVENQLKRIPEITQHEWFVSSSDTFANYSQTRSLRARRLSKDEYERNLMELRGASVE
jgi:hypothetical protein